MKKRIIKFDDRLVFQIIYFLVIVGLIIWEAKLISKYEVTKSILISFVFVVVLVLFMSSLSYGLTFDYHKEVVKIVTTTNYEVIEMKNIKTLEFIEVNKNRVDKCNFLAFVEPEIGLFPRRRDNVYRNGKVYKFVITRKEGDPIEVYYGNLFKARTTKRIERMEEKIKKAIKEFNAFKYNKYFRK